MPQLLVSSTGSIVKANKSAINEFGYDVQNSEIGKLLNLDVKQLSSGSARVELNLNNSMRVYSLASRPVNERLMHVSVQNVTELEKFRKILELIGESAYVGSHVPRRRPGRHRRHRRHREGDGIPERPGR